MQPKVSVSIITYRHEQYIAQALDSILMQETDFNFEIIIGEDGSTDGTPAICQAYKDKYPDQIQLFLNDRSTVVYVDGAPTGKWNLNNNVEHARGEYIAFLEGDDYWTDKTKLQQQVDLMEQHKDWSMCFHDIAIVNSDGSPTGIEKLPQSMKKTLDREELVSGYYPTPPTGSILYRTKYLSQFPDWFYKFKNGDIAISIILSEFGDAGYIDKKMSAYRQHVGGVWSSKSAIHKANITIKMRKMLLQRFAPTGQSNNIKLVIDNYLLILKESLKSGKLMAFSKAKLNLFGFVLSNGGVMYLIKRLLGKKNDKAN